MASVVPIAISVGEEEFSLHCSIYKLTPAREFPFAVGRKWRFDFAWPEQKIAAEIDGGSWSGGRHSRGKGFEEDCRKLNQAALLGWRVFRFTPAMVHSGTAIDTVMAALGMA